MASDPSHRIRGEKHCDLRDLFGIADAIAQANGPASGFGALEQIPSDHTADYQPYWAARGHLLQLLNRMDEAREALNRAAGLTDDPALREYLFQRSAEDVGQLGCLGWQPARRVRLAA